MMNQELQQRKRHFLYSSLIISESQRLRESFIIFHFVKEDSL